jgi:p24 family protein delta-1
MADIAYAHETKLKFEWKAGVAATDWQSLAKKEHLDELTIELRRLEESLREVYADLQSLRKKEEEMRDLNGQLLAPAPLSSVLLLPLIAPAPPLQGIHSPMLRSNMTPSHDVLLP